MWAYRIILPSKIVYSCIPKLDVGTFSKELCIKVAGIGEHLMGGTHGMSIFRGCRESGVTDIRILKKLARASKMRGLFLFRLARRRQIQRTFDKSLRFTTLLVDNHRGLLSVSSGRICCQPLLR